MTQEELLAKLLKTVTTSDVESLVGQTRSDYGDRIGLVPIGKRENNRGQIEISRDPGRGLVERITNAIDGVLELEYARHGGVPECRTPKEAASAWLNIPLRGLHEMSAVQRGELAKSITVTIEEGDDRFHRTVQILDKGIGIPTDEMTLSILSLGETNKLQKLYLAGAYGQGGSSTFAFCTYSLIGCRANSACPKSEKVGFTVVYYEDLPPELFKHGRYVYLTLDGKLFEADMPLDQFPAGTVLRHFGYDLSSYGGPVGPASVYGLLQHALFDPITPLFLEDRIHKYRRVIKGSRNALNGAVDDSNERGPALTHNVPLYYATLGDYGSIGIEYWVLKESEKERYPSRAYVDNRRPIILTLNGQSHAELSGSLIRNKAELPYLMNRLIVHLDCNNLTPQAKRNLFVSSREDVRKTQVYAVIEDEMMKALRSDDQLAILNEEARNMTLKEKDEKAEKTMRSEVAKILRFYGFEASERIGAVLGEAGASQALASSVRKPPLHRLTRTIEIHDPPTYIKILADTPVKFYPGQRRYLRIETDAPSGYHDPEDPGKSRINIILSDSALHLSGSTPLRGGRMRAILDCEKNAIPDSEGQLALEVFRPGLSVLRAEIGYLVTEKPDSRPADKKVTVPPIVWVPVGGRSDPTWSTINWPEDIGKVAASSILESDKLTVYYSKVFPGYSIAHRQFEKTNPALGKSFDVRYRIWLAVHSLLIEQDKKQSEDIEKFEETEHEERCRLATIASMFASREVRSGQALPQIDNS